MTTLISSPSPVGRGGGVGGFDVNRLRAQFPLLARSFHGKPLIYLDNGATTQKPASVIQTLTHYYEAENANIHRGVYALSQEATAKYEESRHRVREFINAASEREIIFTRGTTESINLVAASYGRANFHPGDEILITGMEHHSNIVPWQLIAEQTGAVLRAAPFNDRGELLMDQFEQMLSERTKFVSVVHVSNSLGTINPVVRIIELVRQRAPRAVVLLDGAQWVAHGVTDVQALGCDFYAFSGHKLFGPTGVGVLYGRSALLEKMPPYQGGGDMISSVTIERSTWNDLPNKFEAGTPNIAGVIGLGAAIEFVQGVGLAAIASYEHELLHYATEQITTVPGLRLIGTAKQKAGVLSFVIDEPPIGSYDIGFAMDYEGIAIRTGHHCCQPVMDRLHVASTARASLAMYNTREDVDALVAALQSLVVRTAAERKAAAPPVAVDSSKSREVQYPPAVAASPTAAAAELADNFELLGAAEERNGYLLDLGSQVPKYFDLLKQVTPRIPGCMSEVYLVARRSPTAPDRIEFVADANADIVRGLIAMLQRLFSGQRAADVRAFDIEGYFHRIHLDSFITSQRRNGLAGMIARIRAEAEKIAGEGVK